jgi:uracil-DNA glycosylase
VDEPRTDAPRTNRDPTEIARKRGLLNAPHVAPLTAYVTRLRAQRGTDRVPDFDPTEAGIQASILLLLEAPGRKATVQGAGSGFVSPDNDDASAENMWRLLREAGIDRRREVVTWNIVPWYLGDGSRIRPADARDLIAARPAVQDLLTLLPALRVVVLIGKPATRGWTRLGLDELPTIEAPHPSPKNLNTRPGARTALLEALIAARQLASS